MMGVFRVDVYMGMLQTAHYPFTVKSKNYNNSKKITGVDKSKSFAQKYVGILEGFPNLRH